MILRDRDADVSSGNGLEERIYVLHDANFNVTAITDASGTVLERYAYEAYGQPIYLDANFDFLPDAQSDHSWQHLHQGGRLDQATGNYHFRHRDLSPGLGRWLSQDPIGFEGSPWNLYEYVEGNPIKGLDPRGLDLIYGPYGPDRWHYDRNHSNLTPLTQSEAEDAFWTPFPETSLYHQHGPKLKIGDNIKFLSPDGHMEAVYDGNGNIVTSPANQGTYNYGAEQISLEHFFYDVIPYWIWGNSPNDPTPLPDRIFGPGTSSSVPSIEDIDLGKIIESIIGKPIFSGY
jgi:RHS repeat-associated protein